MRTKFLSIVIAALLTALSASSVSAQVVTASGKVTLKQPDGTTVPVPNATVIFYRTDIKGEYRTKTDKNGRYIYAGIPLTGTYIIAVSAPNAQPTFLSDVRISQSPENDFVLEPGDGSTLTLEQIRALMAKAPARAAGAPESAEARRAREEMEKKRAEMEAERKRLEELNTKLNEILKAGNDAFSAKRYDEAISYYDQGIQTDPEQAVFYRNKALALRARGVDRYNAAVKNKDQTGREAAVADFKASIEATEKALEAQRALLAKRASAEQASGAAGPAQPKNEELPYLESRAESYRLALQVGLSDMAEGAIKAYQEYIAAETDPAKKAKAQVNLADALFQAGRVDEAIAQYRQLLQANPNNLDALYGLGIALASDPAKINEAIEVFKQFAAKAPDTDQRKQQALQTAQDLSESLKQQAQPTNTNETNTGGRTRRRRP
ncbi:carboxypeptidase-like regulatory domain-containing protein [Pyrinomonas methylaliphatogenes]|jgi:tetratricopeptide (TPR) repeat protein|uniref:Tetratricopeptide repeat protein n=1 Tax=Pyrinomonas methylaliphatogenes TaxID=454194 RepID=A0A0B6X072_9BACT|nr:carboxypeptidase-like regulatory domain-containing protein [Pyrinomonas methylaliphatogenes]MBX5479324.1 tetratricopeptide repeat protein [Pyrinomonas methylaliphatogenes]CDM65944.1 hypothetical protein PYK22_01953 [Pyrinomonas methylaliphatogenes]